MVDIEMNCVGEKMDINRFWEDTLGQDRNVLTNYFCLDAVMKMAA